MSSRTFPICKHEGCEDCFARIEKNKCNCLNNTDFNGKKCPFYKPGEKKVTKAKKGNTGRRK